ncbi:hypothetical protein [Amaricoccus macauensis]|uniref:hypothetical protein n=1 Tax=Amaricoccus macauensis TaxID=57001 RepID=UPI003C7E6080
MRFGHITVLAILPILGMTGPALAQHTNHADHMAQSAAVVETTGTPIEPGNGAFAAITEIVLLLNADSDTDWPSVDIGALRDHLVDMNNLVLATDVQTRDLPDGILIRIRLDNEAGEAASRMVPAHGPVLAAETGWSSEVSMADEFITWTIKGEGDGAASRIKALGFYGLLATGNHHPGHHLAIARGEPMR